MLQGVAKTFFEQVHNLDVMFEATEESKKYSEGFRKCFN